MTRRRFTDSEITQALDEYANGRPVGEICRTYGVSNNTFYRWKARQDVPEDPEADKRQLAAENRRLRRLLVETMLEVVTLRERLG